MTKEKEFAFEHMGVKVYIDRDPFLSADDRGVYYNFQTEWLDVPGGPGRLRSDFAKKKSEVWANKEKFKKQIEEFIKNVVANKI